MTNSLKLSKTSKNLLFLLLLITSVSFSGFSQISKEEFLALEHLYKATNGNNWTKNNNWNFKSSPSEVDHR